MSAVSALGPSPESRSRQGLNQLIVFTRYPEPGTTKTRLIPALGAAGAADLQRQMTEHTLQTVAQWQALDPAQDSPVEDSPVEDSPVKNTQVQVLFAGGDGDRLQSWLGPQWEYRPQATGDLGDRMAQAFQAGFAAASKRIVIIGIDCPGITPELLSQAFERLDNQDLVLGPALDGGYYLIGLRAEAFAQAVPALLAEMAWGTEQVLAETLARASVQGLQVAQLQPLQDVDYPEDLPVWEMYRPEDWTLPIRPRPSISVIIPTHNEAENLPRLLTRLRAIAPQAELIICDGGSTDNTVAIAQTQGTRVIIETGGRARQLNRGAALAHGEILLFLHADTELPEQFEAIAQTVLNQPGVMAGAFQLRIDGPDPKLRWIERGVQWRSRFFQLPYGDQGIFLKRSVFEALGGFADLPIMEDFELMQRVRRQGKVAIAPAAVTTSARRWQKLGIVRTTMLNQLMILGYRVGISGDRLAQWYRQPRR